MTDYTDIDKLLSETPIISDHVAEAFYKELLFQVSQDCKRYPSLTNATLVACIGRLCGTLIAIAPEKAERVRLFQTMTSNACLGVKQTQQKLESRQASIVGGFRFPSVGGGDGSGIG